MTSWCDVSTKARQLVTRIYARAYAFQPFLDSYLYDDTIARQYLFIPAIIALGLFQQIAID